MNQLNPSQKVPIVYQIDRAVLDSETYYVQAKVRNSVTEAVIKTVNLTHIGSQRFTGTFETPSVDDDLFLDVETKVYTDSGYTTESQLDAVTTAQYVVRESWNRTLAGVGGMAQEKSSGATVDYQKVREIFVEELTKMMEGKDPADLNPVMLALKNLQDSVDGIETEQDLSPIVDSIVRIEGIVQQIPKEHQDIVPVLEGIQNLAFTLGEVKDTFAKLPESVRSSTENEFNEIGTTLQNALQNLEAKISEAVARVQQAIDSKEMNIGRMTLQAAPQVDSGKKTVSSPLLRS